MIVCVPVPTVPGVYETEQLPLDRVQLAGMKAPVPKLEKETVPPGVDAVPVPSLSVTVAVQVVVPPRVTELGKQTTPVEVERVVTVRAKPVASELLAWIESLAVYEALIVCVPAPAVGV